MPLSFINKTNWVQWTLDWMFGLSLGTQGFSQPMSLWFMQVEWYMRNTQVYDSFYLASLL
jgi:hypothetical protein